MGLLQPDGTTPLLPAAASGAAVAPVPAWIPLGGWSRVDATLGTTAVGGSPRALDPASYARTGLTAAFTLRLVGLVDDVARTGTVTLVDLTTGLAVATISITAATLTAYSAVVTLNAGVHLYELRFACSGTLVSHYAVINNASLEITWS